MTPEEGGVRDPSHPQGNTRVSLADTSLTRALIGSGGIQGGGAGAGVGEGGRAGTGLGGEQGVDTGEARGGRAAHPHTRRGGRGAHATLLSRTSLCVWAASQKFN